MSVMAVRFLCTSSIMLWIKDKDVHFSTHIKTNESKDYPPDIYCVIILHLVFRVVHD